MQRFLCLLGFILCCACSADATVERTSNSPSTVGTVPGFAPGADNVAPGPLGGVQGGASAGQPVQPSAAPASAPVCQKAHIDARPQAPDLMIVLDRSGSMGEQGRWNPSVAAIRRVTQQLQDRIRFGLALFPEFSVSGSSVDISSCAGMPDVDACVDRMLSGVRAEACKPGDIVVPVAPNNAAAIMQVLDGMQPQGGTPTPGTLQTLLTTFAAPPGTVPGMAPAPAKFLLLVTDGQPSCPAGEGSKTTQPDIDATNTAVEALAARNVKTYVIGYDTTGPDNEMLAKVLDGFAMRGGTGDLKHRTVEDEASLAGELQRITGALVECSFVLETAPERADHVLVRVDGKQINLGAADGWTLEGDRAVRFQGAACSALRDGQPHVIDAEVQCSVVVPQ